MADNNIIESRRAAEDFLKAGRKKEHKVAAQPIDDNENGFSLYQKYRKMSDDEFNAGVADGTITPEKKRKAGEYFYNFWMGDVWGEGDHNEPEPTYEEFMANPAKYGVEENEADPWNVHRFAK